MCDLSEWRAMAEAGPTVTVDSRKLLDLLDSVIVVTLNGPKQRKKREKAPLDPNDEKCARWLYSVLLKSYPKASKLNVAKWANDVRLMREIDARTHREICELFKWASENQFWRSNIRCPERLREHWDGLWIQRDTESQPKKTGSAWWASDATREAKAREVGVGPAGFGESKDAYESRIKAAIDNGGKPPAAQVFVRPTPPANDLTPIQNQIVTPKPRGFLKDMLKQAEERSAA